MLEIDALTKRFGPNTAVDAVSLTFDKPAMIGIIGASGAGKSTFLRMVNRLTDATEGRIIFEGTDVTALKGKARRGWQSRCAMIFQQFNLVPRMDVVSNVLHGTLNRRSTLATMFNVYPEADIHRAIEILEAKDTWTKPEVRKAYKALIKVLHPDMNGGDRSQEEQLQLVVWAWDQIKGSRNFKD